MLWKREGILYPPKPDFLFALILSSLSMNVIVNNDLHDRLNVETKFLLTAGPQMWLLFIIYFETLPLYFFLFLCGVCLRVWYTHMHIVIEHMPVYECSG